MELGEPRLAADEQPAGAHLAGGDDGRPVIGQHGRCRIAITEDYQVKSLVDKLMLNAEISLKVGSDSWAQQFRGRLFFDFCPF